MNGRVGTIVNSKNSPLFPQNGKKKEMDGGKLQKADKTRANRRRSARERKLALLEDVDNLKKKLRHEENVHRALERAFNRPLGALPRLPPYLPQYTLELLAEVAVLEEEVVRLEEQVVNFRQGLYQETVCLSSKKKADDLRLSSGKRHSRSLSQSEANLGSIVAQPVPRLSRSSTTRKSHRLIDIASSYSEITNGKPLQNIPALNIDDRFVKENGSSPDKKSMVIGNPVKRQQKTDSINSVNSLKMQNRIVEQAQESSRSSSDDHMESEENKTSEEILKCLINTFVRLSSSKGKTMDLESFSSLETRELRETKLESDFRDPYFNSSEFKKRDIGAYKLLYAVEAGSFDPNRKTNTSMYHRLKILLDKLASVKLDNLNHQQKLAFWINVYNSCIMNAFLEHGIPESPDMIVALAQKAATINVGGFVLTGIMIEHFILRLPYHLKYTCTKAWKKEEMKVFKEFGLEWSEPLVTFALSCGSWSSPAVRVYTASQIETELETAKRDYLQATVGISSSTNKLIVPKLLDWYLFDFAKDLDALLDWICLQLPDQLRNQAVKCLEAKGEEPLSKLVQFMPYNFTFRYLIYMPQMKINTRIQQS
ncbi:hypothetical protein F511_06615 [Dorcoceras hygrometricum]|uniref:Ternary complex factor MIP1 leucine-zipper domain-containing protein n=1 Tax=Dorcoceras hygrometricum TaxID=472368 RepID=A0A2Z7AMR7_9LAMI|nr:hypothetical protein F511_06615 [Dorcoceras hygrometricum]